MSGRANPSGLLLALALVAALAALLAFWPPRPGAWQWWVSLAGHPFTQWIFITLLALAAIWNHRRRRRARRRQWDLEEQDEQDEWEAHRRRYRIH